MTDIFNNLSPSMQARLDRWKKNTLPVKSASILRKQSPGVFVARNRDYGDDLSEFDPKNKEHYDKCNKSLR